MKLKYPLLLTLLIVSNSVFSFDSEYFCRIKDVKKGKCEKNDILGVSAFMHVIQYCNLDRIVTHISGYKGDIDSHFICSYRGLERKDRGE